MSFHFLSLLPLQIHIQVLSKMGSKSVCRMRRACHFYHKFINAYYKQMRNVIRIERLRFSNLSPEETNWKKLAIITNQFSNTYRFLSNFQEDDLCRLQIRTVELFVPEKMPTWLDDALHVLDGRVRIRELECTMASCSEDIFEHILRKIRPIELCLNWLIDAPAPKRNFLEMRSLESIARIEIMSDVDNLDLCRCHPSLLYLKIQNYKIDNAAEWDNLLSQIVDTMEKTNLQRIHIRVAFSTYITTSSKCWIEVKPGRCILYSTIVMGRALVVYSFREKTEHLMELEKIKVEIDECIRLNKVPPYDKFDVDEHEDTILSHYTTFSEESFNCSNCSSDRSILSDSLSS